MLLYIYADSMIRPTRSFQILLLGLSIAGENITVQFAKVCNFYFTLIQRLIWVQNNQNHSWKSTSAIFYLQIRCRNQICLMVWKWRYMVGPAFLLQLCTPCGQEHLLPCLLLTSYLLPLNQPLQVLCCHIQVFNSYLLPLQCLLFIALW